MGSACSKRAPASSPAVSARGPQKSKLLGGGLGKIESGLEGQGGESSLAQIQRSSPGIFHSAYFVLAGLDGSPPRRRSQLGSLINLDRGGMDARMLVMPRDGAEQRRCPSDQGPARSRRRRPRSQDRHRSRRRRRRAQRDRHQRRRPRADAAVAPGALVGHPARLDPGAALADDPVPGRPDQPDHGQRQLRDRSPCSSTAPYSAGPATSMPPWSRRR